MKRGFEHRLWGYKVVKIKQPDAERGSVSSSGSSIRSHSQSPSHDDQDTGEDGTLGIVKSSVEAASTQHGQEFDQEESQYEKLVTREPTARQVPESREGTVETEEMEREGEWQIPETVIPTSESISPLEIS